MAVDPASVRNIEPLCIPWQKIKYRSFPRPYKASAPTHRTRMHAHHLLYLRDDLCVHML